MMGQKMAEPCGDCVDGYCTMNCSRPALPRLRLTRAEFLALPEYSCSIPTGTTTGKRWRRLDGLFDPNCPPNRRRWMIGEYGNVSADGKTIAIKWYRPIVGVLAAT